ncbi:MAG: Crp/Fnr family transcriptional regulator [Pseudomonadota bacterium]
MNKAQIVASLRDARLFRVLSADTLATLASTAKRVTHDADATIFFRGDPPDQVFLVLSGRVAVESMSSQGKTIAISSIGKGEVFGEMAVLDGRDRSANIRTLEPTVLLSISSLSFHALLRDSSAFSQEVIQDLVRRLRLSDAKIESVMFLPLKRRLSDLLLDLFHMHGRELKITQAELAYQLTATREKVNVNLQVLRESGAIVLGRGRIELIDADLLGRTKP